MKTKQALNAAQGTWGAGDVSNARFLIHQWTEHEASTAERALQQSRILKRWIKEHGSYRNEEDETRIQIRENLHRCLHSWRMVDPKQSSVNACQEALQLLRFFQELGEDLGPTAKTYSMCLQVLGNYPKSKTACRDIAAIYNECTQRDLQFYNVCLGALAKASKYHREAPLLAEDVFQDLLSVREFAPDSSSLANLLHAWANGSTFHLDAAQRAQAIMDQMVSSHLELVNTTCFNITIDAWVKQGSSENAEVIIRQMQALYEENDDDRLRPNEVSFNSAIHACAKSGNTRKAQFLLQQMYELGYEPGPETFSAVMKTIMQEANPGLKMQAFLDALEEKYEKGTNPSAPKKVHYLMAIQAWGRTKGCGGDVDSPSRKAEDLLRRMEKLSNSDASRSCLQPCVRIYTAVMDSFANSGRVDAPDEAWRLFQEMKSKSVRFQTDDLAPNEVTVNVLAKAFCRSGRFQELRWILEMLREEMLIGLEPYHTVLRACSDSRTGGEMALEILQDLSHTAELQQRNKKLKPTAYTNLLVLLALGNSTSFDAAHQAENLFWKMMNENGDDEKPDVKHMNCVLRAWSRSSQGGAADKAERFLELVQARERCQADAISHLHLIHAWSRSGRKIAQERATFHWEHIRRMCMVGDSSQILEKASAAIKQMKTTTKGA